MSETKPFAWTLPGDEIADVDGWIPARIDRWDEFTRPLYAEPPAQWQPIETALKDIRVTGEQQTLFVARFYKEQYPSYNCVYYDFLQGGDSHPWCFADGGGAYHKDWPTHWMLAEDAAPAPPSRVQAVE